MLIAEWLENESFLAYLRLARVQTLGASPPNAEDQRRARALGNDYASMDPGRWILLLGTLSRRPRWSSSKSCNMARDLFVILSDKPLYMG